MSASQLSLGVGVVLDVLYTIVSLKNKRFPNLGALVVLFLIGPLFAESLDILSISYSMTVDKQPLDAGVFKDHLYAIGLSGVVLVYAALDSIRVTFRALTKKAGQVTPTPAR